MPGCSRSTISRASCSARATSGGPTATTWRPPRRRRHGRARARRATPSNRPPRRERRTAARPPSPAHDGDAQADVRQVPGLPDRLHRALAGGRRARAAPRRAAPRPATDSRARVPRPLHPILFDPVFPRGARRAEDEVIFRAARERDREGARGGRGARRRRRAGRRTPPRGPPRARPPTPPSRPRGSATVAKDCSSGPWTKGADRRGADALPARAAPGAAAAAGRPSSASRAQGACSHMLKEPAAAGCRRSSARRWAHRRIMATGPQMLRVHAAQSDAPRAAQVRAARRHTPPPPLPSPPPARVFPGAAARTRGRFAEPRDLALPRLRARRRARRAGEARARDHVRAAGNTYFSRWLRGAHENRRARAARRRRRGSATPRAPAPAPAPRRARLDRRRERGRAGREEGAGARARPSRAAARAPRRGRAAARAGRRGRPPPRRAGGGRGGRRLPAHTARANPRAVLRKFFACRLCHDERRSAARRSRRRRRGRGRAAAARRLRARAVRGGQDGPVRARRGGAPLRRALGNL